MGLAGILAALALLACGAAGAREQLDRDALRSGQYRRPVDLSAYAPPPDARPPTHRFEGRLRLSGQPATRTLLTLDDFIGAEDVARARTLPQDLDQAGHRPALRQLAGDADADGRARTPSRPST